MTRNENEEVSLWADPRRGGGVMRWNRTSMAVLMSVICWCAPLMGAQEEPSCGQWNTEEFFETATAKDVAACLADGTGVGVRVKAASLPCTGQPSGTKIQR